jgi:hypothetical protein
VDELEEAAVSEGPAKPTPTPAQGSGASTGISPSTTQSQVKPNNETKPGPIGNCVGCVLPQTAPNLSGGSSAPGVETETSEEEDFDEWRDEPRTNEETKSEAEDLLKERNEAKAAGDQRAINQAEVRLEVLRDEMAQRGIEPSDAFKQYKLESLGGIGAAFMYRQRARKTAQAQRAQKAQGGYVKGPRNPCDHPNDKKKKKKYVVYKADEYDASGKKIGTYVGRTSGAPGENSDAILRRRSAGHHRNLGQLTQVFETDSYSGVRGAEQIYKDKMSTSKQIEPIAKKNKRRQDYIDCAKSKEAS